MSINPNRPLLAISACLAGQAVRYNGSDKYSALCMQQLAQQVDWLAICPEVAIGLPVPRAPIEQRMVDQQLIVCQVTEHSLTYHHALSEFAKHTAKQLKEQQVSGYVLMQRSPSCALSSSQIFSTQEALADQSGFFVNQLRQQLPLLPMIEQQQLDIPELALHFLYQVQFQHQSQQLLQQPKLTAHALYNLHAEYKYLLMARSPAAYKALGKRLAILAQQPLTQELIAPYFADLLQALQLPRHAGRELNALLHMTGYLKGLSIQDQQLLHQLLQDLTEQKYSLVDCLTPLQALFNRYQQVMLYPKLFTPLITTHQST